MVHVEATYRWPATKVPGIVSGCVGVVVGLLSGLFPSSFGLTPDGADVVQYPDPVNAVFFGLTAACLTFLSFSTTWVIVKGKKKRQIRKLAAILSAILLVFLLVWMALYPVSPVLATQIFVVLFTFAFCLQIATISNLGLLPSALAAIVFTWTTTILLNNSFFSTRFFFISIMIARATVAAIFLSLFSFFVDKEKGLAAINKADDNHKQQDHQQQNHQGKEWCFFKRNRNMPCCILASP